MAAASGVSPQPAQVTRSGDTWRNLNRAVDVQAQVRWRIWLPTILLTLASSGCGNSGGPGATDASARASDGTVQPVVTSSVGAPPPMTSGSPVPVAAGKVEVRLGKASYRQGETVSVTVANGLDKAAYAEDFKTVCSIVTLQRAEGGAGWKDLEGCALGRPTMTVTIGPGLGYAIAIDPSSVHFRNGGNRIGFGSGTYRIRFGYRLERVNSDEQPLVAYSPEFTVALS